MTCRLLSAFAAALMLMACEANVSGKAATDAPTTSVPEEITVTALDTPEAGKPATDENQAPVASEGNSKPQMAAEELAPEGSDSSEGAGNVPENKTGEPDTPAQEAPVVPAELKSPTQIACEKKGGVFANAGSTGAKVCVFETRDGGKSCKKESDCEGLCLARSRTCSPFTPVFGCQEILQQDGLQVTQCTE